jgi:hypothetical protein
MPVTFTTYSRVNGEGAEWLCHCQENGKSRLIFSGATELEAQRAAQEFADANLDTPERRRRLQELIERRKATTAARKETTA